MTRLIPVLSALSIATLALSGCVSKKKYEALQTDYQVLEDRYENVVDQRAGLIIDRAALAGRVADLEARNDALTDWYEDLLTDFGPAMERGEVTLVVYPDHTSLVFGELVTFDENEAILTERGEAHFQTLARLMKKHPQREFEVQGHTDSQPIASGPYPTNWELGAARALTVVETLTDAGVEADQLSAATYAATEPLASNRTESGRAINRRVEVALRPDLSEFPAHEELLWDAMTRNSEILMSDDAVATR